MTAPTEDVLATFDVDPGTLALLPGGQHRAWSDGRIVLKPIGLAAEHDWVCEVYDGWSADDVVRVPKPLRSPDGSWSWQGWGAHVFVPGRDATMRTESAAIRAASEVFHAAVAGLERPGFLDERDDDWTYGDAVAWDDAPAVGTASTVDLTELLRSAAVPVDLQSQVVHGDIGGNVVVADRMPPAVIDWPPYHRPTGWALAVAAVDAICWGAVPPSLLDDWADIPCWGQLCLRALIYRVATRGRHEQRDERVALSTAGYAVEPQTSIDAVMERL